MRGIRKFIGQVLPRKVQLLMQIGPPFGTIRHIIYNALIGDKFSRAAFPCIAFQFHLCDDAVWDVHGWNYTGCLIP